MVTTLLQQFTQYVDAELPLRPPTHQPDTFHAKSADKANEFRRQGNVAHALGQLGEALKYYTRSIATAPAGSEALALAFCERSMVLFDLRDEDLGILDANRISAMKLPLPDAARCRMIDHLRPYDNYDDRAIAIVSWKKGKESAMYIF